MSNTIDLCLMASPGKILRKKHVQVQERIWLRKQPREPRFDVSQELSCTSIFNNFNDLTLQLLITLPN
jgi:hypothetical protein